MQYEDFICVFSGHCRTVPFDFVHRFSVPLTNPLGPALAEANFSLFFSEVRKRDRVRKMFNILAEPSALRLHSRIMINKC